MRSVEDRSPVVPVADPSWHGAYRAGGISAIAYVVLGIVAPAFMFFAVGYPRTSSGPELLDFIAEHRVWWMVLQTLTLGPSFLAIVVFLALFLALKDGRRSLAAIGAVLAIVCQALFVSFLPGTLGMLYLADQRADADEPRRAALEAAAEAVTAPLDAFNPLYETVFAVAVLLISLAMLRSGFPRWVAWLGIAAAVSEVVAVSALALIGMGYFWWWLVFAVWFVAVGWRLLGLARRERSSRLLE